MRNPKYVPRNWMLLEAYEAAEAGNFQVVQRLQRLLESIIFVGISRDL